MRPMSIGLRDSPRLESTGGPSAGSEYASSKHICWMVCSDRGKSQGHSCAVLQTRYSQGRVGGYTSRHLDSDETMLGRRTG